MTPSHSQQAVEGPKRKTQPSESTRRSVSAHRLALAASGLIPLVVFWLTLAPSVTLEDSGEFITGAYHLGVLHPPGFPTWCVLAKLATLVPLGSIAQRIHFFSALCGAGTSLGLYLVARQLTLPPLAALFGAWALAFSSIYWSQSVVAEVYTLNTLFFVLLLGLAIQWRNDPRPRWLYLFSLALGLGVGNHILLGLCAPPLAVWMFVQAPRDVLRPRIALSCVALLLFGLSIYAYLPLRARANPPLNWGNPRTLSQTISHIRRDVYLGESGRRGGTAQDVAQHVVQGARDTVESFSLLLAPPAALGLLWFWRHQRALFVTLLVVAVFHLVLLNLLIRAEFSPIWAFTHRVYYLPVHVIYALVCSAGAALFCEWTAAHWPRARSAQPALLGLLVVPLLLHWQLNDRHNDHRARNLALDLVAALPIGAGILPTDDLTTFPLLYLTRVEQERSDLQLLKPDFGWQGGPVSAIYSAVPAGDALARIFTSTQGWQSHPHGLGYLITPPSDQPAPGYGDFPPLSKLAQTFDAPVSVFDPFDQALRSLYCVYHARLGAMHLANQEPEAAVTELARAELLAGDPFDFYLLAKIRLDLDWETERAASLLQESLTRYDRQMDRHAQVLAPVTREQIADLLKQASHRP